MYVRFTDPVPNRSNTRTFGMLEDVTAVGYGRLLQNWYMERLSYNADYSFSGVAIILPYYDYVSYAVPITYLKDTELLNDTHESHYVYDPTIMDWPAAIMGKEC